MFPAVIDISLNPQSGTQGTLLLLRIIIQQEPFINNNWLTAGTG